MTARSISTETFGDVMVAHAPGELTADTGPEFVESLLKAFRRGSSVVVELNQTERLDSPGLESLLDLQERLQQGGGRLRLCGLTETAQAIFHITRLGSQIEVFDSVIDAVSGAR